MLLLQSRGWQQNNRNFNVAGHALGQLLGKAIGPGQTPQRRTERTTQEQLDAHQRTGFYGEDYEGLKANLTPDQVRAKVEERQGFKDTVFEPESLQAYHDLINRGENTPEDIAIFESQLVGEDEEAYNKYMETLNPKERKKKAEWQYNYNENFPTTQLQSSITGERKDYEVEGVGQPNPFYNPVLKTEFRDGIKTVHYKEEGKIPSVSRYRDPVSGKYDKKALDKLKTEANRMSGLGNIYRGLEDPKNFGPESGYSRKERVQLNQDYQKQKTLYQNAKKANENEVLHMIDEPGDNEYVRDLITRTRAKFNKTEFDIPYISARDQIISEYYEELNKNMDKFENPYVMEVMLQVYHEILFGEAFFNSDIAQGVKTRIHNRGQK